MRLIQSPLNYTGGKYKLLPQILPHFPQDINTFVDLFCGGANVGCNIPCNRVVFNDINNHIIRLMQVFRDYEKHVIFDSIFSIIDRYRLSCVNQNGYAFYGCESGNGVGKYNKEKFLQLREDFNNIRTPVDFHYYIMFYVLIVFSFNNQIRFNSKGEFNLPVGKRDFNARMQNKLSAFIDRLKSIPCIFENTDFSNFDINELGENDFVYCDPPYLISCATYNEQGLWNEDLESSLYNFLDRLNARHINFALSNILTSKGKSNHILQQWLEKNPHYICHHLNYQYSNSNYQVIDRMSGSDEVLIINY